jgi:ferredoxin
MALAVPIRSFARFGSITWVTKGGEKSTLQFETDQNLFEVLTTGGVISSDGTCSGNLACGKCQIGYVSGKVAPPEDEEKELLGGANARLACAIVLGDAANGAVFKAV